MKVLDDFLAINPTVKAETGAMTAAYLADKARPVGNDDANKKAKSAIFGQIGAVKLKKTTTAVKTMFNASEGRVGNASLQGTKDATSSSDGRRALSKLVDFPGDVEEIKKVSGGADTYIRTSMRISSKAFLIPSM